MAPGGPAAAPGYLAARPLRLDEPAHRQSVAGLGPTFLVYTLLSRLGEFLFYKIILV